MTDELTKYVESWFARANDDLKAIEVLLNEGGTPNIICFHAQQAAEKYLKGYLAFRKLHARKIHDIPLLLINCEKVDASFSSLRDDANFLTQFYVESRYPDDYV